MEKASGIVIKRVKLNDNDLIITIFTREKGKIQAVAKGARKTKSQFLGTTQLFCYCNFVYYPGKTLAYINQTELIESFYQLRDDLIKLTIATYLIEVINLAYEEHQKDERVLSLLLHSLQLVNSSKAEDAKTILLGYQLKLMGFMGYAPQLNHCIKCDKTHEEYFFSKKLGGLICKSCKSLDNYESLISKEGVDLLNRLLYCKVKEMVKEKHNEELIKYLVKLMNEYISFYTDKKIYSYEFMDII